MNKIKEFIIRHNMTLVVLIGIALGLAIGYVAFHRGGAQTASKSENKKTIYTCSMDPQVRQDHPGKCPICGMDLIPLTDDTKTSDSGMDMNPDDIMLSDEAMALANVQTETVGTGATAKEIRLFGKIQPDERLEQVQSAYVDGRVEKLFINAVGDRVGKGQTLAVIYSPSMPLSRSSSKPSPIPWRRSARPSWRLPYRSSNCSRLTVRRSTASSARRKHRLMCR